ncbi:MAG TPA: penicillin-binding protein 2 [Actinomycetota bacterium]|nr:penicillin-binding protein 2 [Actinomycetota bacterium]
MISGEERVRFRSAILGIVVLAMMSVLVSRLWLLQVLTGEEYALAAVNNSVRLVWLEAPRGRILDRNGVELVKDQPSLAVGLRRDDLRDPKLRSTVVSRLAKLLHIRARDINARLNDKRVSPYRPAIIATDVSEQVIFEIREHAERYPGAETLVLPVRAYPKGNLAAHVLGYVGETTESELDRLRDKGYRLGDSIGRTGIERTYEEWLRGQPGIDKLEVNSAGIVLRSLGAQEAIPGHDVMLSLDAEVQEVAEDALYLGIQRARGQTFQETGDRFLAPAGGVVVLDAQTGEVVAMASYPTFDLRRFVGGVETNYFKTLNDPKNNFPLLNRTMQSAYPPGSTFKAFMAAAALSTGAMTPGSTLPCTSAFEFGNRIFRNWTGGSGNISLAQSLVVSCDTVYYRLGANWWAKERADERAGRKVNETMQDWARRFGLGRVTKIDLPNEEDGRVPGRDYRREIYELNKVRWCEQYNKTKDVVYEDLCERGYLWRGGDAVNMSIGQGDLITTPLQMAVGYAAIANGGKVLRPHVGLRIQDPDGTVEQEIKPQVLSRVKIDADDLAYVRNALEQVAFRGTAVFPFRGWPLDDVPVAAKTGSAEIAGKQPFSWFAAYAPANKPKYVVVSVVEQAGFGSQVSGPIVRRIMDKLFGFKLTPVVFGVRSD